MTGITTARPKISTMLLMKTLNNTTTAFFLSELSSNPKVRRRAVKMELDLGTSVNQGGDALKLRVKTRIKFTLCLHLCRIALINHPRLKVACRRASHGKHTVWTTSDTRSYTGTGTNPNTIFSIKISWPITNLHWWKIDILHLHRCSMWLFRVPSFECRYFHLHNDCWNNHIWNMHKSHELQHA